MTLFSIITPIRFSSLLILLFLPFAAHTQNPFPDYAPIYKDDIVARIDILIPEDSLAIILAPGNEESEEHYHAIFIFDNGTIRDTLPDAGLQLRGNTSRYAKKKSFQVSLNKFVPGRLWYGVEKINLNGEHNDPTVSRSKLSWDLLRSIGIPAPRSSHAELYINGRYFGLYANIEHIDEEFVLTRFGTKDGNLYKCLWPADMTFLGEDPDLYKLTSGNRRVYELKTNEEKDDYTDLAHLIDVLNNTPIAELSCRLEEVFHVNSFLKSIAFDILSGNWDGPLYNKNNFFLYHNLATGLFEYIPYDLDNTFGIDWFGVNWAQRNIYTWGHPSEPRPLYWRILQIPEYRKRMSYYMDIILREAYKESALFPRIDALKSLLGPSVAVDDFYPMDYGFSLDDFNTGFSQTLPYGHTPVGIKPFIATRRSATLQQLQLDDIAPVIGPVTVTLHTDPNSISILTDVEDDQGIGMVEVRIQWNDSETISYHTLYDDGMHFDGDAGDGQYGMLIPVPDTVVKMHYSIMAVDQNGKESMSPLCGTYQFILGRSTITLAVNEFMASNATTIKDDFGEYEDWAEIYNYGQEPVYLGDLYLSDKPNNPIKWRFPDIWLDPASYLLIWLDEHAHQGPLHADIKLSAGGEFIGIFDSDANENVLIDGLEFGQQQTDVSFGRFPDGTGPFGEMHPTPGFPNQPLTSTAGDDGLESYTVYPNPMRDVLFVQSGITTAPPHSVVVVNMFGQIVMEKSWQPSLLEIGTEQLPSGIYILGIMKHGEFKTIQKIVKQ